MPSLIYYSRQLIVASISLVSLLSTQSAFARIHNQVSTDITILRADIITQGQRLDAKSCKTTDNANYQNWRDCTDVIEAKFSLPAAHKIYVPESVGLNCRVMRLRTQVKKVSRQCADGIGFAHGIKEGTLGVHFIKTARLKKKRQYRRASGDLVEVHEFVGLASCTNGQEHKTYRFRPFLGFETPQKEVYRNWDSFGFYWINPTDQGFDQTSVMAERNMDSSLLETVTAGKSREFDEDAQKDSKADYAVDDFLFEESENSYLAPN